MNDQRRILACGSLALVWATGCADPCVDDGLSQFGQADCPTLLSESDTTDSGPEPTTNVTADETAEPPSCDNGIQDGDETDVDCGGSCADNCGNGQGCGGNEDCESGQCGAGMTCEEPPSCSDGLLDGDETDVDCGGSCPGCDDGQMCLDGSDCVSNVCDDGICTPPPSCTDGVQNGDETDLDCGGSCPGCDDGEMCRNPGDCTSEVCEGGICVSPTCTDGVQNGDETDVDCGGSCPACENGEMCIDPADCQSGMCDGGTCVGRTCRDGIFNGDETDVDCGGPDCNPCDDGEDCLEDGDCISQVCGAKGLDICITASCTDGVINGGETDLDCGGPCGATCDPGEACVVGGDCLSQGCDAGTDVCNDYLSVVAAPSCSNYAGAPVGLAATAMGGSGVYTYAWTPNDGSLTTPDQAMTDASPTGFQSYTVTVDDGFTTAQDSVVVVNSQPFDLQNNCTLYTANYGVSPGGNPASISYDMGGTRGCENGNNEFGLSLCDTVVFQNTRLRGVLQVEDTMEPPPYGPDNDWLGLVWGAQDNSHFYSLIWKQSSQPGTDFNPDVPCDPPGGILVRRIEGPNFASLVPADFFCPANTANSTLLLDPAGTTTQGWEFDESYTVTIDFTNMGSAVTVVRDSDLVQIANFSVTDTTYTSGYFGSTTASQQGACVGPLLAECL